MNDQNKSTLKHFALVAAMFVAGMLAIISNVAVWNAVAEGVETLGKSEVVFSVLNLLAEGGLIYSFYKNVVKKAEA